LPDGFPGFSAGLLRLFWHSSANFEIRTVKKGFESAVRSNHVVQNHVEQFVEKGAARPDFARQERIANLAQAHHTMGMMDTVAGQVGIPLSCHYLFLMSEMRYGRLSQLL